MESTSFYNRENGCRELELLYGTVCPRRNSIPVVVGIFVRETELLNPSSQIKSGLQLSTKLATSVSYSLLCYVVLITGGREKALGREKFLNVTGPSAREKQ